MELKEKKKQRKEMNIELLEGDIEKKNSIKKIQKTLTESTEVNPPNS
jgi:hypothetical protein